jgi:hypothetical protein
MSLLITVFISCFGYIKDPITKKFSSILSFGLFIYTAIPSLDTLTDLLLILSNQFASKNLMFACIFFYFLPNVVLIRDLYRESSRVRFPIPIPDKFFFEKYDTIYKLIFSGIIMSQWIVLNSWFWFPMLLYLDVFYIVQRYGVLFPLNICGYLYGLVKNKNLMKMKLKHPLIHEL